MDGSSACAACTWAPLNTYRSRERTWDPTGVHISCHRVVLFVVVQHFLYFSLHYIKTNIDNHSESLTLRCCHPFLPPFFPHPGRHLWCRVFAGSSGSDGLRNVYGCAGHRSSPECTASPRTESSSLVEGRSGEMVEKHDPLLKETNWKVCRLSAFCHNDYSIRAKHLPFTSTRAPKRHL